MPIPPDVSFMNLPTGPGGLNTSFGYGVGVPGGDLFNRALKGMVDSTAQDVSSFTDSPLADQAAGTYSSGMHDIAKALPGRGFTGPMPGMEDMLRGNYLQSLMGVVPQGVANQQQFRQGQLANLAAFPGQVSNAFRGYQSSKMQNRAMQDAQQNDFNDMLGGFIGDAFHLMLGNPGQLLNTLMPGFKNQFNNMLSPGYATDPGSGGGLFGRDSYPVPFLGDSSNPSALFDPNEASGPLMALEQSGFFA